MFFRLPITPALLFFVFAFTAAQAKSGCGVATSYPDFEAGDVMASCDERYRSCRATMVSPAEPSGVDTIDALSLIRLSGTDTWEITLRLVNAMPDISEGLGYSVAKGEPQRVPPEFLTRLQLNRFETSKYKSKILVDRKVAKIVLDDLSAGEIVTWTFMGTTGGDGTVTFSTAGLSESVAWIACKQ